MSTVCSSVCRARLQLITPSLSAHTRSQNALISSPWHWRERLTKLPGVRGQKLTGSISHAGGFHKVLALIKHLHNVHGVTIQGFLLCNPRRIYLKRTDVWKLLRRCQTGMEKKNSCHDLTRKHLNVHTLSAEGT